MLNGHVKQYYENSPWKDSVFCWYPFEEGVQYERALEPPDLSVEALAQYRHKLGPKGKLLLAFENPFALRYWSGKSSPITGLPYDSLLGRDNRPGKAEIAQRLKQAGFEGQKWYYPLTDHWFTREVYSDSYLPDEFLNQRFVPYIAHDWHLQFDERGLYREIIRGGAFTFMCGAYLVEARCSAEDAPCPVDYAAVTAYREPAKRFATTIRNDGTARKTPLCQESRDSLARIMQNHADLAALGVDVLPMRIQNGELVMPRTVLPTLWDYWAKKLAENTLTFEELCKGFDRIREAIFQSAANGKCYWELVPANCFYDESKDRLIFFDQEYCWEQAPPEMAMARALGAMCFSPYFKPNPEWLERLKARHGLTENWDTIFLPTDERTYAEVFGKDAKKIDEFAARACETIYETEGDRNNQHWHFKRSIKAIERIKGMGYTRPAIYGYGQRGKPLKQAILHAGLEPAAILDKRFSESNDISHIPPEAGCDVIVVSVKDGVDIAGELKTKTSLPVLTLEELLDE